MQVRQLYFGFLFILGSSLSFISQSFATEVEIPSNTTSDSTISETQNSIIGLRQFRSRFRNTSQLSLTIENQSEFKDLEETSFAALPDTISDYRKMPEAALDQSGRTELITSSLAYSIFYYGWAVPVALEAESGRAFVASYMILGGGGFFVPFLATRNSVITEGMACGFSAGAGLGIAHGWAFSLATMGEDVDGQTGLGISVGVSLAEGILGLSYAKNHKLSLGHASMLGTGGAWGGALVAPMPYFFGSEDVRPYALSGLVGSGLGIWAGDKLSKKMNVADGDPQIISTTGAIGGFLTIALLNSITSDLNKATAATLIAGTGLGLGLGIRKIKGLDYSTSEANLIALGSFAGGLIGLGLVYVAAENAGDEAYLLGSAIGAAGGFVATDRLIKGRRPPKLGNLKIQFNPIAVRNLIKPGSVNNDSKPDQFSQPHLVTASLRF